MTETKNIEQQQQPLASNQKLDPNGFGWKKMFGYKWVEKNIPFFLFLSLLAVIYIYNGHYNDKMTRKISVAEKHIKELEYEYKTIKSEVIFRSKASELVKAVEPLGLKELLTPPVLLKDSIK